MISIHISQLIELQKTMPTIEQARKRTKCATLKDQNGSAVTVQFELIYFIDRWAWKPITPMEVLI
jgi:hypothetical protein